MVEVPLGFVEGIDGQLAGGFYRFAATGFVEHDAAAEPTHRRGTFLMQHGIGPNGNQLVRASFALVVGQGPRDILREIEV